jgi:hypothetical protein
MYDNINGVGAQEEKYKEGNPVLDDGVWRKRYR